MRKTAEQLLGTDVLNLHPMVLGWKKATQSREGRDRGIEKEGGPVNFKEKLKGLKGSEKTTKEGGGKNSVKGVAPARGQEDERQGKPRR